MHPPTEVGRRRPTFFSLRSNTLRRKKRRATRVRMRKERPESSTPVPSATRSRPPDARQTSMRRRCGACRRRFVRSAASKPSSATVSSTFIAVVGAKIGSPNARKSRSSKRLGNQRILAPPAKLNALPKKPPIKNGTIGIGCDAPSTNDKNSSLKGLMRPERVISPSGKTQTRPPSARI